MLTLRARLINAQQANTWLNNAYQQLKPWLIAGHAYDITIKPETRSSAQNRLMWSCLNDLSEQVFWDGKRRLTKEGWKDYLTAHLNGQDLVPNMDGSGFVAIGRGKSTSQMTKAEMTAVIDLAHAFGTGRDVRWSTTSLGQEVGEYA